MQNNSLAGYILVIKSSLFFCAVDRTFSRPFAQTHDFGRSSRHAVALGVGWRPERHLVRVPGRRHEAGAVVQELALRAALVRSGAGHVESCKKTYPTCPSSCVSCPASQTHVRSPVCPAQASQTVKKEVFFFWERRKGRAMASNWCPHKVISAHMLGHVHGGQHTLRYAYRCEQLGEGVQQHLRDGGVLSRAFDCSRFLPRGTRGKDRRARGLFRCRGQAVRSGVGQGCIGCEVYPESQRHSRPRARGSEKHRGIGAGRGLARRWTLVGGWSEACRENPASVWNGFRKSVGGSRSQAAAGMRRSLLERTRYRSVVATGNFISQDRPDVRFAVKELCREMARPTCASRRKLKKLDRYLSGQPRVVQKIKLDVDGVGNLRLGRMLEDEKNYERWMYHGRWRLLDSVEHDAKSRGFEQRRGRVLRGHQGSKRGPWFLGRLRWLGNFDQWLGVTQSVDRQQRVQGNLPEKRPWEDPTHRCCHAVASGLGAKRENPDVQNPGKGEPRWLADKVSARSESRLDESSIGFLCRKRQEWHRRCRPCGCCLNNCGGSHRWVGGAEEECRQPWQ